mmetsp:Transcript_28708/g.50840  ORF Transcript_28708/g.50840 Transcript_28708/m.50840 type:complete len:407 (+) Transcript_28708:174-1394(+)
MLPFSNIFRLLTIVGLLLAALRGANGQGDTKFPCGDPSSDEVVDVSSYDFSTIIAGSICNKKACDFLIPEQIHWHIYSLASGSKPKQTMFPPGIVRAQVSGGVLKYTLQNVLQDYDAGQEVQAGVNLYIPIDRLKTVQIHGVDQFVEVRVENWTLPDDGGMSPQAPLRVVDYGVHNEVFITSPTLRVNFADNGADNMVHMEAASGSSLDLSGVDSKASVKCPRGLSVRTSGVENSVFVEGQIRSATMEGVDGHIQVNENATSSPCSNVAMSGVGNRCSPTSTAFTVESLPCLSNTEVGHFWHYSTDESMGIGIGFLFLFLGIALVIGCVFCCEMCGQYQLNPAPNTYYYPSTRHNEGIDDFAKRRDNDSDEFGEKVIEVNTSETEDSPPLKDEDIEQAKKEHAIQA